MAYADLLQSESSNAQMLVVMRPRRVFSPSWEAFPSISATAYRSLFELGQVTEVTVDGEPFTHAASLNVLSQDEYFFDETTGYLYIDTGDDPSTHTVVATYELYFGTFDAQWHRIPNDSASRIVYYEPLIERSPTVISSSSETLYGFLPTYSANLTLSNLLGSLYKHLYDSSFNLAPVEVWYYIDELTSDSIRLIFEGFTSDISITDRSVSFNLLDSTSFFDTEWRNELGPSFFSTSDFPNLDPNFVGRPIRKLFGRVSGIRPVNIDYRQDNPTTSDNREYVICNGVAQLPPKSIFVTNAGTNTIGQTFVDDVSGVFVGDFLRRIPGGTGFEVTGIGANYFFHTPITPLTPGDELERSFVSRVEVFKEGRRVVLGVGPNLTAIKDNTLNVLKIQFSSGFEAAFGFSEPLNVNDTISVTAYGEQSSVTIGGIPFRGDTLDTLNEAYLDAVFYKTIRQVLPESRIETTSLQALLLPDVVSFSIPESSQNNFPTIRELVSKYCITGLLRFFLNNENKWQISIVEPIGSEDLSITDEEIIAKSFNYKIGYRDILSRVEVAYQPREIGTDGGIGKPLIAAAENNTAKYLHVVDRQKTFNSIHLLQSQALDLALKLSLIFGERRGVLKLSATLPYFETILSNSIKVSRDRMIGFDFLQDVLRERTFQVIETNKTLSEITIEMDDLKGTDSNLWPT